MDEGKGAMNPSDGSSGGRASRDSGGRRGNGARAESRFSQSILFALTAGGDCGGQLDALQEEAEREELTEALAEAYDRVLRTADLSEVSPSQEHELCLYAAWACVGQERWRALALRCGLRALSLKPTDEQAISLVEPLLLEGGRYSELAALYTEAARQSADHAGSLRLLRHGIGAFERRTDAQAEVAVLRSRHDDLLDQLAVAASAPERAAKANGAANGANVERHDVIVEDAQLAAALSDAERDADVAWEETPAAALAPEPAAVAEPEPAAVFEPAAAVEPEPPVPADPVQELRLAAESADPGRLAGMVRWGEEVLLQGRASEVLALYLPLLDAASLDDAVFDVFERLAEQADSPDVQERVLERRAELQTEPGLKARALERLGDFLDMRANLGERAMSSWRAAAAEYARDPEASEEAKRVYERVLERAPADADAAERLIRLYVTSGQWALVVDAFRILVRASEDPKRAADFALSLYDAAVAASACNEFVELVDDLVSQLGTGDVGRARRLSMEKARMLSEAARYDEAAEVYQLLITRHGGAEDVAAFERLIDSNPASEWRRDNLRWLFEWRVKVSERPVDVMFAWAEVETKEFQDPRAAREVLERAAALAPERADVWEILARQRIADGDASSGIAALEELARRGGTASSRKTELELARVLLERQELPDKSLAIVESVLARDPKDRAARELAFELSKKDEWLSLRAFELLERATLAADDDSGQIQVLTALLLSTERGRESAPELRCRCFARLLRLDPGAMAVRIHAESAAEFLGEPQTWDAVEQAGKEASDPSLCLDAYVAAQNRELPEAAAKLVSERFVLFAQSWAQDPRVPTRVFELVLDLTPGARWALDRVKLYLTQSRNWEGLFARYDAAVEATHEPDERTRLLDEAAVAARDVASDPRRAIGYWEAYVAERPGEPRVELALERLYERLGLIDKLIVHLSRRAESALRDDRLTLDERVAKLYLDQNKASAALAVVERLLRDAPEDARIDPLLERVREVAAAGTEGAERDSARRAAGLLKTRYREAGKPADIARVTELELVSATGAERGELLVALGVLRRDALSDPDGAFTSFCAAFELSPEKEPEYRRPLLALAEQLGSFRALVDLYTSVAARLEPESDGAPLLEQAARLALERLDDPARAAEIDARIFEIAAALPARLAAGRELEGLLEKLGRTADRCSALEALAELEEGEARVTSLREAARVALEELADFTRAAARYRRLLQEVPHDAAAHDGLVTALTRGKDLPALAEALLARARLLPGSRDERRDLAAAAQVYAEELRDHDRAIELWYQIRKSFGRETSSFEALSGLLERASRWEELASLLSDEADAEKSAALYQRLGKLHREHTRDPARAYAAFSSAGDVVAAALTLTQAPALYTDSPAEPLALVDALASSGQSDLAEGVLRGQLSFYGPTLPPARKTVHLALAKLLESLGHSERAVAELSAAANAYLSDLEVLSLLSRVAAKHGDWDRAEQSYRSLLLALHGAAPGGSTPSRAEIYVALSEIKERRGDAPAAKELVESAFEVALENQAEALGLEAALRSRGKRDLLERAIAERLARPNELASAAEALSELTGLRPRGEIAKDLEKRALGVAERVEHELRAEKDKALVLAVCRHLIAAYERLGAPERAVSLFESLETKLTKAQRAELEVDLLGCLVALPERRATARERLEKLVEKNGEHGRAFDLFCQVLAEEKDFAELVRVLSRELRQREQAGEGQVDELRLRIGRASEQAGDAPSALESYRAAAGNSRVGVQARAGVVRVLETLRPESSELADALEQLIESEPAADRWEHTLRLLALRTQLGEDEGRERALKWAVAARPEPSELLDQLVAFHRERGQHDKIIDVLEAAVRAAPGATAERIQLSGAYRSIGRPETALERLERVAEAEWTSDFRRERFLVLEALGRADGALEVLRTLTASGVEATPDVAAALSRIEEAGWSVEFALAASEFFGERDLGRARAVLDRYLERDAEDRGVLERAAALAVKGGDLARALSLYERLARASSGGERITAVLCLSRAARGLNRPEAALDALESTFTADPEGSPEVRAELGTLYRATAAHAKLGFLLMIEARSQKDPEKAAELLVEAASLLHSEGDEEAAEMALTRAHELDPSSVEVAVLHAQVLATRGQRDAAFASLAEFAKAPGKRRAKSIARVHRAVAALHLAEDELAEALPALLQAHQLDRADLELAMQLGLLAVDLDRHDLAASALRLVTSAKTPDGSSAETSQTLSVAYYHLACIECLHGRKVGARRMVARALEENPDNTEAQRLNAELGQP